MQILDIGFGKSSMQTFNVVALTFSVFSLLASTESMDNLMGKLVLKKGAPPAAYKKLATGGAGCEIILLYCVAPGIILG